MLNAVVRRMLYSCIFFSSLIYTTPILVHGRRYREFVGLDEKLQHFYGNLGISLPPKRTMGNRDKEFLEKRKDHLELYLNVRVLIGSCCYGYQLLFIRS